MDHGQHGQGHRITEFPHPKYGNMLVLRACLKYP